MEEICPLIPWSLQVLLWLGILQKNWDPGKHCWDIQAHDSMFQDICRSWLRGAVNCEARSPREKCTFCPMPQFLQPLLCPRSWRETLKFQLDSSCYWQTWKAGTEMWDKTLRVRYGCSLPLPISDASTQPYMLLLWHTDPSHMEWAPLTISTLLSAGPMSEGSAFTKDTASAQHSRAHPEHSLSSPQLSPPRFQHHSLLRELQGIMSTCCKLRIIWQRKTPMYGIPDTARESISWGCVLNCCWLPSFVLRWGFSAHTRCVPMLVCIL